MTSTATAPVAPATSTATKAPPIAQHAPPRIYQQLIDGECQTIFAHSAANPGTTHAPSITRGGAQGTTTAGRSQRYVAIEQELALLARAPAPAPLQAGTRQLTRQLRLLQQLYLAGSHETGGQMDAAIAVTERRAAEAAAEVKLTDCFPQPGAAG